MISFSTQKFNQKLNFLNIVQILIFRLLLIIVKLRENGAINCVIKITFLNKTKISLFFEILQVQDSNEIKSIFFNFLKNELFFVNLLRHNY